MSFDVYHGPLKCRRCWPRGGDIQHKGDFKLVHDPGYWGASQPITLVLGISKGNTQSRAYAGEPFDKVAFKGIRHRVLEILQSVGLLPDERSEQFERRFTSAELDFAFASVVRCSLTGLDRKKGIHTADSPNVLPAFRSNSSGYDFVVNCVDQYLVNLSSSTKLVVLLSNTDAYIAALQGVLNAKRGNITPLNEVGYFAGGVKFVHVAHPSRGNGHYQAFVRGEGSPGRKRDLAREALKERNSD
ncbi:MAG TPA: hypothetical protein VMV19_12370 [Xanthobacteraceae bacterium]|nr:hypothetical protein [Xanthobacteraceae bacterium]